VLKVENPATFLLSFLSRIEVGVGRMGFRNFKDPDGHKWDVWFVRPTSRERRESDRRRENARAAALFAGRDRRTSRDRRVNPGTQQTHVAMGYENGWLCFESETGEKRRLVWAPEKWENLPVDRLWVLCRVATHIGKPEHSQQQ